jgi:hypothetical protein
MGCVYRAISSLIDRLDTDRLDVSSCTVVRPRSLQLELFCIFVNEQIPKTVSTTSQVAILIKTREKNVRAQRVRADRLDDYSVAAETFAYHSIS